MGGQKAGFTRWFERGEIEKKTVATLCNIITKRQGPFRKGREPGVNGTQKVQTLLSLTHPTHPP